MIWVAIEDADTCEVSEFEQATEENVYYLMNGYKVDTSNPTRFRLRDVDGGQIIFYKGAIYKGGFGYNLWVAHKVTEL